MKIKNIVFITLLISFISSISFAQVTSCSIEEIEKLKQSTVVVALSDDEGKNKYIQEIMQSYWTVSKFNVIKASELETYIKANPENFVLSYLLDNSTTYSVNADGKLGRSRTFGDGVILNRNLKKIQNKLSRGAMMYCYFDWDLYNTNKQAELMRQIGSMNAILAFQGLNEDKIGAWKIPTINQKEIITKELWVSDKIVDEDYTEEAFAKDKNIYKPYKCKRVSLEEMAKAIIEKRKDIVYMAFQEYEVGKYLVTVHSAEDNRVLFLAGRRDIFKKIKENKPYGQ